MLKIMLILENYAHLFSKNAEVLKSHRQVPTTLKEPCMENGDAGLERYL